MKKRVSRYERGHDFDVALSAGERGARADRRDLHPRDAKRATRWLSYVHMRLGLPDLRERHVLVAAMLVDGFGTGLFLPFAVIYATIVAHIPLGVTGGVLSLASVAALPVVPITGALVDRFGARHLVITANLLQAAGFAGYPLITRPWHLFACAVCVGIGNQMFWAANGSFIAQTTQRADRTRWFALQGACRSAGLGSGAAVAGISVALAGVRGYPWLAVLNALSFVGAAALLARVPAAAREAQGYNTWAPANDTHTLPEAPLGGYRQVLRDGPFLGFTATNVAFSLIVLSSSLVLPAYVLGALHQTPWVVGLLFTLNTALVMSLQTITVGWIERYRRTRALACAAGLFGLSFLLLADLSRLPAEASVAAGWVTAGLIGAMGLYTLAELIMAPLKNALVTDAAPQALRGRYLAFYHLSWSFASAVAPALLTGLLSFGPLQLWLTLAAIAGTAALALWRLDLLLPVHAVRPPLPAQ